MIRKRIDEDWQGAIWTFASWQIDLWAQNSCIQLSLHVRIDRRVFLFGTRDKCSSQLREWNLRNQNSIRCVFDSGTFYFGVKPSQASQVFFPKPKRLLHSPFHPAFEELKVLSSLSQVPCPKSFVVFLYLRGQGFVNGWLGTNQTFIV